MTREKKMVSRLVGLLGCCASRKSYLKEINKCECTTSIRVTTAER